MNRWDYLAAVELVVLLPLIIPMCLLCLIVGGLMVPVLNRGRVLGDG